MTWKSKLEKAAKEWAKNVYLTDRPIPRKEHLDSFKDGAEFARAEMMKEAQVLVEALNSCKHEDCIGNHFVFNCKCQKCAALKSWRENFGGGE